MLCLRKCRYRTHTQNLRLHLSPSSVLSPHSIQFASLDRSVFLDDGNEDKSNGVKKTNPTLRPGGGLGQNSIADTGGTFRQISCVPRTWESAQVGEEAAQSAQSRDEERVFGIIGLLQPSSGRHCDGGAAAERGYGCRSKVPTSRPGCQRAT